MSCSHTKVESTKSRSLEDTHLYYIREQYDRLHGSMTPCPPKSTSSEYTSRNFVFFSCCADFAWPVDEE